MAMSGILDACEDLHAAGAASHCLSRVLEADGAVQAAADSLLRERDTRKRAAALMHSAAEVQDALMSLATRMHTAQGRLAGAVASARGALAAADEARASGRNLDVAAIMEYSERVSYSNAAPCGPTAFSGAERNTFYQGWGTPTPQQHMVAASRFARAEEAESDEAEEASKVPVPIAPEAPAFTAVAPQQVPSDAERTRVSLSFGESDEEDDEFE